MRATGYASPNSPTPLIGRRRHERRSGPAGRVCCPTPCRN